MLRYIQIKLSKVWEKIPNALKNKYIVVGTIILVHLTFIDKSNIPTQIKLSRVINDLEKKRVYYTEKSEELKEAKLDLEKNKETFAREKYFLQKENEEIFIIDK